MAVYISDVVIDTILEDNITRTKGNKATTYTNGIPLLETKKDLLLPI